MSRRWSCLLLVVAGCRFGGVEPQPLAGPMPRTIAVSPCVPAAFMSERELLMTGLGEALGARGYGLVVAPVVAQMLVDAGLDPLHATVGQIGRLTGADAVLVLDVTRFTAVGQRPLARGEWDLQWRLVTPGGGALWSRSARGNWQPSDAYTEDPNAPLDRRSLPGPQLLGGPATPTFRDAVDLMSWLHQNAFSHLPRAVR